MYFIVKAKIFFSLLSFFPSNNNSPSKPKKVNFGVDSSLDTQLMCVGHYDIELFIYKNFLLGKGKRICSKGMLKVWI